MGHIVGGDGLTDANRDEHAWLTSDADCEGCAENIRYGDEAVLLRLVYPAPYNGGVTLPNALDEDTGSYTANPVLFCFLCWDAYTDDLRASKKDSIAVQRKSAAPSPLKCAYCQVALNWGDYCAHIVSGELDTSPRTHKTEFVPASYEAVETAELVCMDCICWINEECDENIWSELWFEEGLASNGQEVVQQGV